MLVNDVEDINFKIERGTLVWQLLKVWYFKQVNMV